MNLFFTMLEDIKNVMSSKRLNSDSNIPQASVQDTKTGKLFEVKTDSDVSIVFTCVMPLFCLSLFLICNKHLFVYSFSLDALNNPQL